MNKQTKKPKTLKSAKKLNRKLLVAIVAVVALVGGYLVYRSSASSFSFSRTPQQMNGGALRQSGGVYRRNVSTTSGVVKTYVGASELRQTKKICYTFVANSDMRASISSRQRTKSGSYIAFVSDNTENYRAGQRVQECGNVYLAEDSSIEIYIRDTKPGNPSVGILSVYGIRK